MKKALVVLSGGQDSATCAAWAVDNFKEVEFLSFYYGQRHVKELNAAKAIAALFDAKHKTVEVPILITADSALTDPNQSVMDSKHGLPATFVPGRNLIFLTQAASYAICRGISDIVTGVCQTDYSGYPDCRAATITSLETSIYLGNKNFLMDSGFRIHTPLMYKTKADTVRMAAELPMGMEAVALSWTCYEGGDKPCGVCPACILRQKGFEEAGMKDPAL